MPEYSKPLAEYVRVSRVGERDEDRLRSPDFQREAIDRFAAAEGFTVERTPNELDVSGSKSRRPVLDTIIERVRGGELGGIVVAKLDRLSRMPPRDRVALFDDIEGAGGVILSASEQLDPSTPEGRFARDVFLGVARMQWEKYAEGFEHAKSEAMARGALIGPTPFGYRRGRDGRLAAHPEHAPIVEETFRRAAREGLGAAVEYLDSQGLVRERGKLKGRPLSWTTSTVRRLLSKRTYLGEGRYGELKTPIPQLVPRAVWEAAQPEPAQRRRPSAIFPLSGFALCGQCEAPLVGARGGTDAARMYRCSAALKTYKRPKRCTRPTTVTAALLEEHVRGKLVEALRAQHDEHRGFGSDNDASGVLQAAEDALASAELELADLTGDLALRRTLGAERFRELAARAVQAVEEAQERYHEAAKRAESKQTALPSAELVANASLEELGELLRGPLEAVIVTRGRTPLPGRVRIVPKGAPAEAVAAAG